ncbi:MAG: two-component system response regulator [Planctomycetota bacterium]|nr:MAG: two-component system response regulator [Planctomycetota bacterium]
MGVRILIVDDAPYMRLLLKKTLEGLGHEVVGEAEDGSQAITRYEELEPELVTLDVVMPSMTGIDALKELRARHPQACVVMVSAIDQREHLLEALKSGAADYVTKPFDAERVGAAIERARHRLG